MLCTPDGWADSPTSQTALTNAIASGGVVTITASIPLTNSVTITNSITLDGGTNNPSLSGAGTNGFPLFIIGPGAIVTFKGLTFTGGRSTNGGAMFVAAGAQVTVTNCTFTANKAFGNGGADGAPADDAINMGKNGHSGGPGSPAFGGAVGNVGAVTLMNCRFLTNVCSGGSGGNGGDGGNGSFQGGKGGSGGRAGAAFGGAIWNSGTLSLQDCTFFGNSATGGDGGSGGAAGTGAFAGSSGNGTAGAAAYGAAIYNTGSLTVLSSTFAGNVAQGGSGSTGGSSPTRVGQSGGRGGGAFGGAIANAGPAGVTAVVTNSTFFHNQVLGGTGGDGGDGSYLGGKGGAGGAATGGAIHSARPITVVSCTFSASSAAGGTNGAAGGGAFQPSAGHVGASHGGNIARTGGTFSIANSLVASSAGGANGFGRILDKGFNISSDNSLAFRGTSKKRVKPDIDIGLAENGGLTETIAALSTSLNLVKTNFPPVDQRGTNRPVATNGFATVGAYEFTPPGPPFITVPPAQQTVPQSSTVTFSAAARGLLPMTFEWFSNNFPLANYTTNLPGFGPTNEFPRITNSIVVTTNADPFSAGPYSVLVTNALSSISATGSLRIAPLLVWGTTNFGLMTVPQSAVGLASISSGLNHMLALRTNNTVVAWGAGSPAASTNQFGQGTVPAGLSSVVAIAAGGFHSLALRSDQSIIAWGAGSTNASDNSIQFGQATVPPGLSDAVAIAAGGFHSLALRSDSSVIGWGAGSTNSPTTNNFRQATPPANLTNVAAIAAGFYHSLAVTGNGQVVAWGRNQFGQTNVPNGFSNVVSVAGGGFHSLAVTLDGLVVGWGLNVDGQATGVPSAGSTTGFVSIAGTLLTNVVAVSAGLSNSVALLGDGTVKFWGRLPLDPFGSTNLPPGLTNAVAVSLGASNAAVMVNDGSPFIVRQPLSNLGTNGQTALFNVAAVGAPILQYRWFFNSTNILAETNSTLVVTNVHTTNEGGYSVVVSNAFGSVTSVTASLILSDGAPRILTQPVSPSAGTGQTATLSVRAIGALPLNYQWNLAGTNLTGQSSSSLSVTNVQTTNTGPYQVVISNSFGSVTSRLVGINITNSTGSLIPSADATSGVGLSTPRVTGTPSSTATPSALTLSQPFVEGGNIDLSFPTLGSGTYILEYKNSLADPNWIPLATNAGTGNFVTNRQSISDHPSRFYRVRRQ